MGSLFAARFTLAGLDTTLYSRPSPHLTVINESGLTLEELDGIRRQVRLRTTSEPSSLANAELALVMVKAWATDEAIRPLVPHLPPTTTMLTLQNGLGNVETIATALPDHTILAGVTSQGAVRAAPGTVRHTGAGPTILGQPGAPVSELVRQVADLFNQAGIATTAVADVDRWLWRKLAVNSAINGPTALAGVPNGAIATDPRLRAAAAILAGEVAAVAWELGLDLDRVDDLVMETARATTTNRSSMLQDLEAGRRTEVGAIYDAVIAAGERVGIDTPANRVISAVVHAREENTRYDQAG